MFTVIGHRIAYGFRIAALYGRNIPQTQLVVFMALNDHVADLFDRTRLIGDRYAHALIPVVVVTGIESAVLSVQGGEYFCWRNAECRHSVRTQRNIDTLLALSVKLHPGHAVEIGQFALDQSGIVGELSFAEAFGGQGVKHTVNQTEIVLNRHGCTAGQRRFRIGNLVPQHIPTLFEPVIGRRTFEFYLYDAEVVVRPTLRIVHLSDGTDRLFQRVGHFQFHFVRRRSRTNPDHHGDFYLDFGIFEFSHVVGRFQTAYQQYRQQKNRRACCVRKPICPSRS